jgi:hypothetical protein
LYLAPIPVFRQSFAILTWVSCLHTTLRKYINRPKRRQRTQYPGTQPRTQHVSARVTDRYVNTIPRPFGGQHTSLTPRQQASRLRIGRYSGGLRTKTTRKSVYYLHHPPPRVFNTSKNRQTAAWRIFTLYSLP